MELAFYLFVCLGFHLLCIEVNDGYTKIELVRGCAHI
jgi:hypothetical protein